MKNRSLYVLCVLFITSLIIVNSHAEDKEKIFYRSAHTEVCFEVGEHKVQCGNFVLASKISTKKYTALINTGADVMASFSAKTHPGDHAVLQRLAKYLGYITYLPLANTSIFNWDGLTSQEKGSLLTKYSSVGNTKESQNILYNYLDVCINYWASPDAIHDRRLDAPTLAQVSALCIADSGALQ
jgi:hypothetical protein